MQELAGLIAELSPNDGFLPSRMPEVRLLRSAKYLSRRPMIYEPCVVIIAQGRKIARIEDRAFEYSAQRYLTLSAPLAFESETFGTQELPVLGIAIQLKPAMVADILLQLKQSPADMADHVMQSCEIQDELSSSAVRLLRSLRSDEESRILGPGLIREVVFRVISGASGANLSTMGSTGSNFGRIAKIMNALQVNYADPHDVESMAQAAGMSVSSFHSHFRTITATSPLQYLKSIRLHRARMLMVNESLTAAEAAARVGYESTSQFSREFKRLFGDTPRRITAQLHQVLSERGVVRMNGTLGFED